MNDVGISPLARRLAEENNVNWRRLEGSGPEGRVVERDVLDFLAKVMAGEEEVDPTPEPLPEGLEAWPDAGNGTSANTATINKIDGAPGLEALNGRAESVAEPREAEPAPLDQGRDEGLQTLSSAHDPAQADDERHDLDDAVVEPVMAEPDSATTDEDEPLISEDVFLFEDDEDATEEPAPAASSSQGDGSNREPAPADEGGDFAFWSEAEASGQVGEQRDSQSPFEFEQEGLAADRPDSLDGEGGVLTAGDSFLAGAVDEIPLPEDAEATEPAQSELDLGDDEAVDLPVTAGEDVPAEVEESPQAPLVDADSGAVVADAAIEYGAGPLAQEGLEAQSDDDDAAPSQHAEAHELSKESPPEPQGAPDGSGAPLDGAGVDADASVEHAGETTEADLDSTEQALLEAAAIAALPLVSYGTLLRRHLDLTAVHEAQHAVARALGAPEPIPPTPFVLRAAAKALSEEEGLSDSAALAVMSEAGVAVKQVGGAAEMKFRDLVEVAAQHLAAGGTEQEDAALAVADMSAFQLDEAVLNVGMPVLTLGRILFDNTEGVCRSTLSLSGELPPETGARLLARIAELLDSPVQLVM